MGWNHLIAIAKGPIIKMHIKGYKQIFYVKTVKIFVFVVEATILIYSLRMLQSVWVQHLTFLGHKLKMLLSKTPIGKKMGVSYS